MADRGEPAAITGMGVVTGIGEDLDTFWTSLVGGRSAVRRWPDRDPRHDSRVGGDMSHFSAVEYLDRRAGRHPAQLLAGASRLVRGTPRPTSMTMIAALQAWTDAGLDRGGIAPERVGHVCSAHNTLTAYAAGIEAACREQPAFVEPMYGIFGLDTDAVGSVCELLDVRGASYLVGTACASGGTAIIAGLDLLRSGRADVVLVTGAAAVPGPAMLQAWARLGALSIRSFNDEPERASRPFDALREGFVPSEGAGAVVLERPELARRRGARVHASVLGGACNSHASRHIRSSQPDQARVMREAMLDAGVGPEEVDYVNAHATSTPRGDATEVAAIAAALGRRAREIPVNSTKSMLGHTLGAAGVIEVVATVLQIGRDVVHPTINQDCPDPALDLDFVPNQARAWRIGVALSNSFGFGGLNNCVVVGRPEW